MALLEVAARSFARAGVQVHAATVDHGIDKNSKKNAAFVVTECRKRGLPCQLLSVDLGPSRRSIEARARASRYAALEAARVAAGADAVLTAHTASDQAETLIMRLGRGSALRGAAGILQRRESVVRPMLRLTRAEVRAYLTARGVPSVIDPMNADPALLRTRVRQGVLPVLRAALEDEAVDVRLAQFSAAAAEDEGYLSARAMAVLGAARVPGGFDRLALATQPNPVLRRVLAQIFDERGVVPQWELVARALDAVRQSRRTTLDQDRVLTVRGGRVAIERAAPRRKLRRGKD